MRRLRAWTRRVAGLFASARRDRELAEEIESHLRLHIDEHIRQGLDCTGHRLDQRAERQLSASLGGLALSLTLVGIYGVVAFAVGQRMRELAIRMALGAARRDILRLVMRQSMTPVAIGLVAGWLGLVMLTPLLRAQLHGISPFDPTAFAVVSVTIVCATLWAIYLPARLAVRSIR